ncbi:hypothetical protein SNE40_018260 [Patella caerulea]|uniref:Core-binding (CB) domain-containing protein n=1 Tax=Patella caerulea TaxID=87958 RepID=A0AAN8J8F6_PATCE
MVPETVLVSSTPGSVDRPAIQASDLQGSVISEQRPVSSQLPRGIKFGGVENFKQSRPKKKFSSSASRFIEGASYRRPSTRRLYDSRISEFREWCKSKKISVGSASVEKIADFFVHLHKTKGCQYNTIMGYRSAIASFHKGFVDSRDGTVSTNPDLSKLIKGIFNASPPCRNLPNWDLPSVLWKLCDPPFEPLSSSELKFLTWKTAFLVALASASRVGELHALSVDPSNFRKERSGIRLLPNINFLAKTQRIGKTWTPIYIPKFNNMASDPKDLLLCPCRALDAYIDHTKNLRSNESQLFITYQEGYRKPAAKSSLS